jgi:hypothetical protein
VKKAFPVLPFLLVFHRCLPHCITTKSRYKRSLHKGKHQDEGHAGEDAEVTENLSGMNDLGQGLSTELGDVKEEIRNMNAKPIKVRRSSRLAAMEEPARTKAAKFDVCKASRTPAAALQDDARSSGSTSTATPAALHTVGQECGLSPDEIQAAMLLSSMYRCSPSLP